MNVASWLGKFWTLPNTLLGLSLGLPALAFGARVRVGHNAIQFLNMPIGHGAIALGNVILYAACAPEHCGCWYGHSTPLNLGLHEEAHTRQYEVLGPAFIPVYLLCGGISARNPFERAANAFADGGHWWPR